MSIHACAPTRIDFAGGWSDVAEFAAREEGTVVNAAISLQVRVDILLGGGTIRLRAEDIGERLTIPTPGQIAYDGHLDLHKAALNMLPVTGGLEILSRCEAPPGAGLGGSGALDVALLAGLAKCRNESFDAPDIAEMGFQLETSELTLLGGKQDQYAAALGGFHELVFSGEAVTVRPIDMSDEAEKELARHTVLVYTGQTHFSSQTHERVWQAFRAGDPQIVAAIRNIRDVARAVEPVLAKGDWQGLASLVDENWTNQQALDGTMSTPITQTIERTVRDAGAWGLKATGAGAGGCVVILCPAARRDDVARAAEAAGARTLDFRFHREGVAAWEQEDAAD